MDPLSLTASVIAVVQLAGSCLNLSKKWLGPSEFNSVDLAAVTTTLHQFTGAMDTFQRHLETHRNDEARLSSLQYLSPVLERCKEALAIVQDFVQNSSFIGKHVVGPRFDRKLKASLKALEAAKELFRFALHADNNAILLEVDQYIQNLAGDIYDFRGEVTTSLKRLHERLDENTEICRGIKRARGEQDTLPTAEPTTTMPRQSTQVEKPSLNEEQRRELLDSLRFDQIDARQMTIKNAHSKTCKWLLEKREYLDWLDSSKLGEHHGFLWIKGKPGTGKSTLMKFALANARKKMKETIILAFFFNARGGDLEKSTIGMYRSLLLQLLECLPALQDVFDLLGLVALNSGCHQWSVESLKLLFEQAVQNFGGSPLMCFIDALDECDENQIRDMVSFFKNLGELTTSAGIRFRVCYASRHYPHITVTRGVSFILEGQEGHTQDIANYVKSELEIGHSKLAEQIRAELQEKAAGVFIWVVLVVEMLNKEHDGGRIHALRKRLRNIPGDLHELFRNVLMRDRHNRGEMLLCIQWVLFARQPLKPEQLYFAILSGIEPEVLSEWDANEITAADIRRFILNSSKGLAEITTSDSPTVQFIHESVRDFLLKENRLKEIWSGLGSNFEGESHERLKRCCISQLYIDIDTPLGIPNPLPPASSKEAVALRQSADKKFPFLEYATRNVLCHADSAEGAGVNQTSFLHNFQLAHWIKLHNLIERHQVRRYTHNPSLLYILAEGNLADLIRVYRSRQSCFAVEDERYGPPIIAALATGSDEAVRASLQLHSKRLLPGSPLYDLCKEFSKNGEKIGKISRNFTFRQEELFSFVVEQRNEAFLAFFVAAGRANVKDRKNRDALSYAAERGYEVVVQLLLEQGAITDAKDSSGLTPLWYAIRSGHGAVVQQLLDKGVDVNAQDKNDKTPLLYALEKGHEDIVRQLLDQGADVNAQDKNGKTPLLHALKNGHEAVVRQLLDKGGDVETKDENGRMLLSWAAANGHEAVVRRLLDKGAEVEAKDEMGRTPLSWAAANGHEAVVQLLLDKGADFDAKDKNGRMLLWLAAENGHGAVVRQLLDAGADVKAKDKNGRMLLSWAAANGHEAVVRRLLDKGAEVEAKDEMGRTPLSWAAANGHEAVVQLLLDKGADVDAKDYCDQRQLSRPAKEVRITILKLLLEKGIQVDATKYGRTPLSYAAENGQAAVLKLLKSHVLKCS